MTAQKESKLVFPLTGGVVEDVVDETTEGAILVSENTRLSVNKGTLARRPTTTFIAEAPGAECGAIVNGCGDSMAAYFRPRHGQKRIVDSSGSVEQIQGVLKVAGVAQAQNAYYPNQITNSGQAFSCQSLLAPSVTIDSLGNRWLVVLGTAELNEMALYVKVYSSDGDLLVSEREIARPSKLLPDLGEGAANADFPDYLQFWFGLTSATSGVVAWYMSDGVIYGIGLTLNGTGGVTATSATSVYTLGAVLNKIDICSDGGQYAYLIAPESTTGVTIRKIDQTTFATTTSVSQTASWSGDLAVSIQHCVVSGGERILVGIVSYTGNQKVVRYSTALAVVWSTDMPTSAPGGGIGVHPWLTGGVDSVAVAITNRFATEYSVVYFYELNSASGAVIGFGAQLNFRLQSRGFFHKVSETEIYPYFPIFPNYTGDTEGLIGPNPASTGYVIDPSIEVVSLLKLTEEGNDNISIITSTVARMGVDRSFAGAVVSSNSNSCSSGKAILSYLESRISMASSFAVSTTRWVELDLAYHHQPSVALDEGKISTVAAAYPVVWDGTETVDVTFAHRPIIKVENTGGTGPTMTGTFAFTAVFSWRDAAGNLRRSAPALPVSVTLTSENPTVEIIAPLAFRNSLTQGSIECTVYATLNNGFIFYANDIASQPVSYFFSLLEVREPNAANERLYSTGAANEPLLPACPPPLWDITTIGNRQWAIDAEFRNRVLPSKLKEPGVGFEFAPELAIEIDQQYGKLMKIVDVGGNVFILAERGTWAISGYGPDNSGQGAGFSDPQLVNTVGCFTRHSVVQVPGIGVLYQAQDGRFAMLGGSGAKRFETINVYAVETPIVHMAECEIVYPITGTNEAIVYNWLQDGWTHWEQNIAAGLTAVHTIQDTTSKSYFWVPSNGQLRRMDSSSVADVGSQLTVERGWIAPEGPQGDICLRELWVQLKYPEGWSHALSVTVEYDYNQSTYSIPVTREWSSSELTALAQGERVTVGINCQGKSCRSFKVRVSDSEESTDYMMPLNLTVTYGANAGNQRRALRASALK